MPQHIDPPKDIRVEVRVRNNLILSRMEHRGIDSVAELARQMGIDSQKATLYVLVNMTKAARNKGGTWHELAYKLADFFDCMPEELFSEFQQEIALETTTSYAEATYIEMQRLATRLQEPVTPELAYEAKQLRGAITHALGTLTPREARVIRLRFGFEGGEELTLKQIGKLFNVSGARIRAIEMKALRKLRHPSRSEIFSETVMSEGFDDNILDAL